MAQPNAFAPKHGNDSFEIWPKHCNLLTLVLPQSQFSPGWYAGG